LSFDPEDAPKPAGPNESPNTCSIPFRIKMHLDVGVAFSFVGYSWYVIACFVKYNYFQLSSTLFMFHIKTFVAYFMHRKLNQTLFCTSYYLVVCLSCSSYRSEGLFPNTAPAPAQG
jgi:hypothetical protein